MRDVPGLLDEGVRDGRVKIDVVTIFPDMIRAGAGLQHHEARAGGGAGGRARRTTCATIRADRHRSTDDTPYGGGAGMVMRPARSLPRWKAWRLQPDARVVLLTPQGETFTQAKARELSEAPHLVLLCGHYEGFDERVREHLATDEISIGDYVLTGGELPALVVIDAVTRLLPGALGSDESAHDDTFADGLLEYPHYTRPPDFRGWRVPDVLLSGNHAEIARWRRKEQFRRTQAASARPLGGI